MVETCNICGNSEFRKWYEVKHTEKKVCMVCEKREIEQKGFRQTRLIEEKHNGFKIGDIVRFKDKNPDYDLKIVKFYTPDFVSLSDLEESKGFSASAHTKSLEKINGKPT